MASSRDQYHIEAVEIQAYPKAITRETERRNALVFFVSYLFIFLAAPVFYVTVVQAALCDKLGASATVANLPTSANLIGNFAPIFLSWLIPCRLERSVVVWANALTSASLAIVCVVLIVPLENSVRIASLIAQSLIMGSTGSVSQVYMYQCLGRGTNLEGRVRALKLTFAAGPIFAVIGSLWGQYVLNRGIPALAYPYDFALLYFVGVVCMAGGAFVSRRYDLLPVEEEPRQPFFQYLVQSLKFYARSRSLALLWFAYVFWYFTLNGISNLSLYTREALGRDPKEFSGLMMALTFGCKSLAGFVLGVVAGRWGVRAPLIATSLLVGSAMLWAWAVPGYFYLLAFGLMGAGMLGGVYFPNYVSSSSSALTGARNLALLSLAAPVSSLSPALHGALTDTYGFPASFAFGIATALLALYLVWQLPSRPLPCH